MIPAIMNTPFDEILGYSMLDWDKCSKCNSYQRHYALSMHLKIVENV